MFRFTIRDMLWLTLVVGIGVAWWFDRKALKHDRDEVVIDNIMITGWIDPQAQSLPRDEKERLWKKYESSSRLIQRKP